MGHFYPWASPEAILNLSWPQFVAYAEEMSIQEQEQAQVLGRLLGVG